MKKTMFTTVFVVGLMAASCQKDKLVNASMEGQTIDTKLEISSLNSPDFDKNYGGSQEDDGTAIATAKDGGYVIAGRTRSNDGDISGNHGDWDGYLIKVDKQGNKLWQKCYGGSKSDEILSIAATKEGGYIFAGMSDSPDGDLAGQTLTGRTLWIVKVDGQGNIEWSKVISNNSDITGLRQANFIIQTRRGDYILAGNLFRADSTYNGWFCKLNNSSTVLWQKTAGSIDYDSFQQVVEDQRGNLWLAGTFGKPYSGDPITRGDVWLVKADRDGNIAWQKQYGGNMLDEGNSLAIDHNQGIILAGTTYGGGADVVGFHGGPGDAWVIKVDLDGKKIWQKSAGGTGTDLFYSVIALQNGGYLLAGMTTSHDGDVKSRTSFQGGVGWLVRLSDAGEIKSERTYGTLGDTFNFVIEGAGKNYAVGGTEFLSGNDYNAWLIGISKP